MVTQEQFESGFIGVPDPAELGRMLEALNWTQRELARRADIALITVSRLVRQVNVPKLSTLRAMGRALREGFEEQQERN